MQEKTQKLGEDAKHLTEALSSNGKVQGDWGEQMLETILQNSGLQEGINYETQISVADENNKQKRPDVIVHCPDGRDVIIDSKVSLTAYLSYISAKNDEERDAAAKENLKSIKKHIDELVKKDYSKQINNAMPTCSAISTVLMFIPNEGSYVLAMESDKNLANDAFKRGILLLNPTNLMLALNIVSQLWNIQNQEDHCKKIIDHAGVLYEKFCTFTNNFIDVGEKLAGSVDAFTKAKRALNEGPGNIVKRLDELKTLGVNVKKEIDCKLRE